MGKDSLALNDIIKVIERDSIYKNSYYERGEAYLNLKEYDKALLDFKIQLKMNPKDVYALDGLGYFYAKCCNRDSLDKAVNIFSRIIEIDSTFANAYCSRGYAYYNYKFKNQGQNFDELALNDFNKAIELDNDFSLAYYNRAGTNWSLANLQEAYNDYRKAKQLCYEESDYLDIDGNLKQLHGDLKTLTKSRSKIEKYSKRILNDPENAELYYERGMNYLNVTQVSFVKKETEIEMKKKAYSDFCIYLKLEPDGEFSKMVFNRISYLKNELKIK